MARARSIKPGFFCNDSLVELPFEYRLLFIGLWTIADKRGRLLDRPKKIRMEIFPADNVDCDAGLAALAAAGFLVRYEAGGARCIQILNWDKHQNPHMKEAESSIEPIPERAPEIPVQAPAIPERARLTPSSLTPDSGLLTARNAREARPVPRETRSPDFESRLQSAFPRGTRVTGSAWGSGIRLACRAVDEGIATAAELIDAAERYAASVESRVKVEGERARQFVMSPAKFFDPSNSPPVWRDDFPLAVTKAQAAQDDNVAAGIEWLRQGT